MWRRDHDDIDPGVFEQIVELSRGTKEAAQQISVGHVALIERPANCERPGAPTQIVDEDGERRAEFRAGNVPDMTWAIIGAVNIAIEVELCHPELSIGPEGLARVLELIFEGIAGGSGPGKDKGR